MSLATAQTGFDLARRADAVGQIEHAARPPPGESMSSRMADTSGLPMRGIQLRGEPRVTGQPDSASSPRFGAPACRGSG